MATSNYDPKLHSKNKMGLVGSVPVVPMVPIAAQVGPGGALHLKLLGDSYVTGYLRGAIPPARVMIVKAALESAVKEGSYSGSSTEYARLDVEAAPGGGAAWLKAGPEGVKVCGVLVDPDWEIVSSDEPIMDQVNHDTDEADLDDDPDA